MNLASEARAWLFDAALPFWFERGIDRQNGGFHDLVGIDGARETTGKRTFVQARQIYVFAEAGRLGWPGKWHEAVETGIHAIDRCCRSPSGGFIHSLDEANRPLETQRDLYDHAFVAFGLAKAGAALERSSLVDEARSIFHHLDEKWAAQNGGYIEGDLKSIPYRRQNPHMHLFEAALMITEASGGKAADLSRANEIAALFCRDLVDQDVGILREYFTHDWNPAPGETGEISEPGHHFEWAWLLGRLQELGESQLGWLALRLWRFAAAHGIDRDRNIVIDEIYTDGRPRSKRARLWPQAERLRTTASFLRRGWGQLVAADVISAYDGLRRYLETPMQGAFFDKLQEDDQFVAEPARASSLYHVTGAISELLRLAGQAR
jgi:mannose-6-phosphate isomerase